MGLELRLAQAHVDPFREPEVTLASEPPRTLPAPPSIQAAPPSGTQSTNRGSSSEPASSPFNDAVILLLYRRVFTFSPAIVFVKLCRPFEKIL